MKRERDRGRKGEREGGTEGGRERGIGQKWKENNELSGKQL